MAMSVAVRLGGSNTRRVIAEAVNDSLETAYLVILLFELMMKFLNLFGR